MLSFCRQALSAPLSDHDIEIAHLLPLRETDAPGTSTDANRDLQIVFFVWVESRIESAVYTTQAVTQPDGLQAYRTVYGTPADRQAVLHGVQAYNMLTTSIVNEREWRTELSTCSFQFSPKTRQTMPLYAYLTPKIDFKRKFNHHQSFLYEWRLTAQTIRKFRIGPSLRIESRIGRRIRNRIESRSFAGPYCGCQLLC